MRKLPPIMDRPPTLEIMRKIGLEPDPWQVEVIASEHSQIMLNCCRQAGKSTVVALLGLVEAMFKPMTRIVLVSRSHRQSRELLKTMHFFYRLLGDKLKAKVNAQEIELCNLSRIVCVPCREDTIRGYAAIDLLIIDEAARVPDDLYKAVRPMLAVSKGRIICLSTPYGKRGFFWDAWANGGDDWLRIEAPAATIPRIGEEFLARERRGLGESWFRQEYCCSFEAMEGLVYPDFARCVVPESAVPKGLLENVERWNPRYGDDLNRVGGVDFGFRNPFAAVWGVLDRDGVLWLTGEHYQRQRPISHHAAKLPRGVTWHADPSGASEIAELRRAGHCVVRGKNDLTLGIAAVTARLEAGMLRVVEGRCPKLVWEAGLYRYDETPRSNRREAPLDEHNHALAALRYLIYRLDYRRTSYVPEADEEVEPSRDGAQKWRHWSDPNWGVWVPFR
jgi:hypothetical protein